MYWVSERLGMYLGFCVLIVLMADFCYLVFEKTIHSGITKNRDGNKTYRPFSDDLTHDQAFVRAVMEEMLGEMDIEHG